MAENITVDPKDAEDNKVMAILAYLGILVLVPIFAAKESPFARYHANQGLILFIIGIAASIILSILSVVLISIGIWWLYSLIALVISVGLLILAILGIINAVKGEAKPLPFIGNLFTILK